MVAEIITVGTEITTGDILDINTQYISNKLFELGIETYYHTTVDDCPERLKKVMNIALDRSEIIITAGGLGPTQDDLTKEIISEIIDLPLELNLNMEDRIINIFKNMNKLMTNNNRKQAMKPTGSKFINNSIGTAPGILIEHNNKIIILLPGPPKEMIPMLDNEVVPLLNKILKSNMCIIKKSIISIGIEESSLEAKLISMKLNYNNIQVTTFSNEEIVEIKIVGKGRNKEKIKKQVDLITKKIINEFKEYIYGTNNISLEESVINLLKKCKYKLGLCESCTGGLISSRITNIPGASTILDRSIVSYSNESKIEELAVNKNTLKEYGAVSSETAYEMAKGLLNRTKNLDIVLSITGIAGPSSDSSNKPVGLVYICIMDKNRYIITEHKFSGDRLSIQRRATIRALDEIRKFLLNYY